MGVAVGDVDNDGWLDLYVTTFGSNVLFRNRRRRTLRGRDRREPHVDDPRWSASAAFLDYDRDGDLDLFVANYVAFTVSRQQAVHRSRGARDYCPPLCLRARARPSLHGTTAAGTFADVTRGVRHRARVRRRAWRGRRRFRRRRLARLYVANDATPNQLWINQHDGTFEDDGPALRHRVQRRGRPEGSMGIASGDADNDGDEDLFVTNIVGEIIRALLNDGTGISRIRGRARDVARRPRR